MSETNCAVTPTPPQPSGIPLPPHWGPLVTVEQAKQFLTFSHETVLKLADEGKLRAICSDGTPYRRLKGKRGKRGVRIVAASVSAFLLNGLAAPAAAPQLDDDPPPPEPRPVRSPARSGRARPKSRIVLLPPGRSR